MALHFALCVLFDQEQLLRGITDRNHQAAAGGQFVDEGLGDMIGGRGHDDDVEGRLLRPAMIAVAAAEVEVVVSQREKRCWAECASEGMISTVSTSRQISPSTAA